MTFSAELRQRRTKMKLSLREAAKGSGISHAMLSRFERGVGLMEMSADKAAILADFFRWKLGDMMRKMREESLARGKSAKAKV